MAKISRKKKTSSKDQQTVSKFLGTQSRLGRGKPLSLSIAKKATQLALKENLSLAKFNSLWKKVSFDEKARAYLKGYTPPGTTKKPKAKAKKSNLTTKKRFVSKNASKKNNREFIDEDGDETSSFAGDEIAPTPEYHELLELDRYAKRQQEPDRKWVLAFVLGITLLVLVFIVRNCLSINPKSKSTPVSEEESLGAFKENKEELFSPHKETKTLVAETAPVVSKPLPVVNSEVSPESIFSSRKKAIHFINSARVSYIKQTLDRTEEADEVLVSVLQALQSYPELSVRIQGHTCFIGEKIDNQKLSEDRAAQIFEFFTRNGIDPDRLKVRGYGETTNIDTNDTTEGRRRNRRVDFTVLSSDFSKLKTP